MKKIVCLILAFSLLTQPLAIPLSVLAQTPSTPTPTGSGPTQPPPSPSSSSFSYDSSGNLLSDGERVITWDVEGKPVRVIKGDLETTFLYDSSGTRIGKIVKDKQTGQLQSATIYFGGNLEKELNPDGTTKSTTRYYFAGGKRIAQRKNESGKPEELTYIHTDHLSSSTFFTDSSGNPSASSGQGKTNSLLTYYPYGETRTGWDTPSLASIATNRLYTGQLKDTETDLYYYNARYYNQKTGLFISPDYSSFPPKNRFGYVDNNPLRFFDPNGQDKIEPGEFKEFYTSMAGLFEPGSPEAKMAFFAACAPVLIPVGILLGGGADTSVDIYEATMGIDVLTGTALSPGERALSAAAIALPFVSGSLTRNALKRAAIKAAKTEAITHIMEYSSKFGEYLGRGGTALVFGKGKVATKLFYIDYPEFIATEIASLKKANIVNDLLPQFIGEVFEEGRLAGYQMERIENYTQLGKYQKSISRDIASKVLAKFEALHASGYYHGDIKAANILVILNDAGEAVDIRLIDPMGRGILIDDIGTLMAKQAEEMQKFMDLLHYKK